METFGFRGEALASLCAMCESVVITTATSSEAPMGTVLELDRSGRVLNQERRVARQRGTTVLLTGLFTPLPVRRKEFERHAKREYGKALNLLTAYALVPCAAEATGVKLTVSHISDSGYALCFSSHDVLLISLEERNRSKFRRMVPRVSKAPSAPYGAPGQRKI